MSATVVPKPIDVREIGMTGGSLLKRAIKGTDDDDRGLAEWLFDAEDNPTFRLKATLTINGLALAVRTLMKRDTQIAELRDQVTALIETVQAQDARIKQLEARPKGQIHRGPWSAGTSYHQGDTVSRRGLWIAMTDTKAQPGQNGDWCLAVKDGRDGRQ